MKKPFDQMPALEGVKSLVKDEENPHFTQSIANYWKPSLSVIGFEGLPNFDNAGYVIYKEHTIRCALRLPPTLDGEKATQILKEKILEDSGDTFGAKIDLTINCYGNGLNLPKLPESIIENFSNSAKVILFC